MPRDLPAGLFKTPFGYRAYVRLSPQKLASKRFPEDTATRTMVQWQEDQRVDFRRRALSRLAPPSEGFTKDAETYLKAVAHMPSYDDRARDIAFWVTLFADRPRASITSPEIAAALSAARSTKGTPLSASALNHRRTALAHLWRVLDGKSASNPVRDVPKRREPDAAPRGLSYQMIRQILAAMADPKTKARLMVIAWTGIPPAQLKTITAADLDLKGAAVYVRGRAKGHGTKGRRVPLSPEGVRAFEALVRADAFGPFERWTMWKAFRQACKKVDPVALAGVRPYDLRHSYGTELYAASGDIRATQILMGHSKPEMTHRYTLGAVDEQVGKALAAFAKRTKK